MQKTSLTFLISFPRRGREPQIFGRLITVNVAQEVFFFSLVVIILRLALLQGQIDLSLPLPIILHCDVKLINPFTCATYINVDSYVNIYSFEGPLYLTQINGTT